LGNAQGLSRVTEIFEVGEKTASTQEQNRGAAWKKSSKERCREKENDSIGSSDRKRLQGEGFSLEVLDPYSESKGRI